MIAKSQPRKINPRKKSPQVIIPITRSIWIAPSMISSTIIEMPVTPPVTSCDGTTKIAQPKASIRVPITTRPRFLSWIISSAFDILKIDFISFTFLLIKGYSQIYILP